MERQYATFEISEDLSWYAQRELWAEKRPLIGFPAKALVDVVEAIIGVIYSHSDMQVTLDFIDSLGIYGKHKLSAVTHFSPMPPLQPLSEQDLVTRYHPVFASACLSLAWPS